MMSINVEARYLDVKWKNEHTVEKVECANDPLEIEEQDNGDYQLESITYKKHFSRLAFRILDSSNFHIPFFQVSGNETKPLIQIKDPNTQKEWWIDSSGWDDKVGWHQTELFRTVGSLQLVIQNKRITINNNSLGFTVGELEAYLEDFKNDLWMLILNNQSHIKGNIERQVPGLFSRELIGHFQDFVNGVERIIKKPTIELRETQEILPKKHVRPVNRTFMELAVKGNPPRLTSRSYKESLDTPENRYIHHAVSRALYLIRQIHSLGDAQQILNKRRILSEHRRLESFNKSKTVDQVVFNNELDEIESDFQLLEQKLSNATPHTNQSNNVNEQTYRLKLTNQYANEESTYFCDFLDGESFKEKWGTYLVVQLPEGFLFEGLSDSFCRVEIELTGNIEITQDYTMAKKMYNRLIYYAITSAKIINHPLKKLAEEMKRRKVELEAKGWEVPFSSQEQEEIQAERAFIQRRIDLIRTSDELLKTVDKSVSNILQRMKKVKIFFEEEGIGTESSFPNKMVFVQNPNYSLAKSAYNHIAKASGLDESQFDAMLSIDKIGLVNISNLYEKWCLLKIIGILTDVYSFSINGDWQRNLITAVSQHQHDIKFELTSNDLNRSITLTYEKNLSSGKRPDFVLDIKQDGDDINSRYVLDAKFRDNLNDKSLADLVDSLYQVEGKNYSENEKNAVFILHASNAAISSRTSPLDWGRHSDYGQKHAHRYGGIYVSPSLKHGRSVDNLQRLIGLMLEQSNEYSYKEDEGIIEHNAFCIACGNGDKSTLAVRQDQTKTGRIKWILQCGICGHLHVDNFCFSCGEEMRLKKNGYYWTYHRTRAEQPFNIVCPDCQEFL